MSIEAWYMDSDAVEDQRAEHRLSPNEPCSPEALAEFGVLHWKLDADICESDPVLEKIRRERGYSYQDIIEVSPDKLPNYEAKLKSFYEEHIHADEEIRYFIDGEGYFDVRDPQDRWIRVYMRKGDMIVLPAGIYHRFTLTLKNYGKAMRLFVGEPVWTPYNRPQEDHPARQAYVASYANAA